MDDSIVVKKRNSVKEVKKRQKYRKKLRDKLLSKITLIEGYAEMFTDTVFSSDEEDGDDEEDDNQPTQEWRNSPRKAKIKMVHAEAYYC